MRTDDKNYHYDGLDGFEPVKTGQIIVPKDRPVLSIYGPCIQFTQHTWRALGCPEYITTRINPGQMRILVQKADPFDLNSIRVTSTDGHHCIYCRSLSRAIEKLIRYDLNVVNVFMTGESPKSIKDALIFDAGNCKIVKKQGRK